MASEMSNDNDFLFPNNIVLMWIKSSSALTSLSMFILSLDTSFTFVPLRYVFIALCVYIDTYALRRQGFMRKNTEKGRLDK